jgi:nicotinamide-nucleotide amidase
MMNVELIAVGSELMDGRRLDTDSPDLARRLSDLGFTVRSRVVLPDEEERVAEEVRSASRRSDLVILTGGLGPTRDDLTREALAEAADRPLVLDEEALEGIRRRYADRKKPVPEGADRQARMPEGAELLSNRLGTAPGIYLRLGRARVAALPGVPREMVPMFEKQLLPRLREILPSRVLAQRIFKIAGLTESEVDETLGAVELPGVSGLSLIGSPGVVEIHVRVSAVKEEEAEKALDDVDRFVVSRFGPDLFGRGEETLSSVVGALLESEGATLATAESCTGGMTARFLTDVPGSSAYFLGGLVTYSNRLKHDLLGVSEETLDRCGAVSAEVASAMATGARERTGATYALAITGIAGPEGGTEDKPVGLTFVALSGRGNTETHRYVFPGDRKSIRRRAAWAALDRLRRRLLGGAEEIEEG